MVGRTRPLCGFTLIERSSDRSIDHISSLCVSTISSFLYIQENCYNFRSFVYNFLRFFWNTVFKTENTAPTKTVDKKGRSKFVLVEPIFWTLISFEYSARRPSCLIDRSFFSENYPTSNRLTTATDLPTIVLYNYYFRSLVLDIFLKFECGSTFEKKILCDILTDFAPLTCVASLSKQTFLTVRLILCLSVHFLQFEGS